MRCSCGKDNPASQTICLYCNRPLASGPDWRRLALDGAAAAGLVLALALVWGLDHSLGSAPASGPTTQVAPGTEGEPTVHRRTLRLAVTPHEYDDMAALLGTLGAGYQHTKIAFDDLLEPERLTPYDAVFLTCGGVPRQWLGRRTGEGERGSSGMFNLRPKVQKQLETSLRRYVSQGGTLYVSDWQLQLLAVAFPEFVDSGRWTEGEVQTIQADVVDPGLRRVLGERIELRFDQPGWYSAPITGADATTYLRGSFKTRDGRTADGPLLTKVPCENGAVVFTSFHNETQNSKVELELLKYLVFATVTAREETSVKRTMVRGGFSPKERNLLSLSSGSQPVEEQYECRQAGPLQFVLGFEDQGAKLQLTAIAPDGTEWTQTGQRTFRIDIPDAAAGTWRYKIAPLEVPYQNFPFTLTIGEKQP